MRTLRLRHGEPQPLDSLEYDPKDHREPRRAGETWWDRSSAEPYVVHSCSTHSTGHLAYIVVEAPSDHGRQRAHSTALDYRPIYRDYRVA